jgi:ribosomal protein L37AE/L43A
MSTKLKKAKSWRTCPNCGSRATKMFHLSTGLLECQICDHQYDPSKEAAAGQVNMGKWARRRLTTALLRRMSIGLR